VCRQGRASAPCAEAETIRSKRCSSSCKIDLTRCVRPAPPYSQQIPLPPALFAQPPNAALLLCGPGGRAPCLLCPCPALLPLSFLPCSHAQWRWSLNRWLQQPSEPRLPPCLPACNAGRVGCAPPRANRHPPPFPPRPQPYLLLQTSRCRR
jgi:hypothetical protein